MLRVHTLGVSGLVALMAMHRHAVRSTDLMQVIDLQCGNFCTLQAEPQGGGQHTAVASPPNLVERPEKRPRGTSGDAVKLVHGIAH